MSKPYRLCVLVGRFQVVHKGHQAIIDKALELCENVGIFIGSSQESGTNKNPFTYEMRKQMLENIYGSRIRIYPLPDIGVGNNCKWGDYVIENVIERFGEKPDLMISGKEERRVQWLEGVNGIDVAELYIPKTIEISACRMRELMVDGNFDEWKEYCDESLWSSFSQMRDIVLQTRENTNTSSV